GRSDDPAGNDDGRATATGVVGYIDLGLRGGTARDRPGAEGARRFGPADIPVAPSGTIASDGLIERPHGLLETGLGGVHGRSQIKRTIRELTGLLSQSQITAERKRNR